MRSAIALLFGIVTGAHAQSADSSAPTVDLRVKPLLCIIDERTPQCEMAFLVQWQSSRLGDYCLFNDFAPAPLKCWTGQRGGELMEQRVVRNEFRYWMADDASELAAVKVEVLRLADDDRRRRRRSRHVWDLL